MYLLKKLADNHSYKVLFIYLSYYLLGGLMIFVLLYSGDFFKQKNALLPDLLNVIAMTYVYNFIFLIFPLLTAGVAAMLTSFFYKKYRGGFIYAFFMSVCIFFLFNLIVFLQKII
jgi:hypothetical protein